MLGLCLTGLFFEIMLGSVGFPSGLPK